MKNYNELLESLQKEVQHLKGIAENSGGGGINLNDLYPIGSIYITAAEVCPLEMMGIGVWKKIAKGCSLQGAADEQPTGEFVEAGLPNIVAHVNGPSGVSADGAFTVTGSTKLSGGSSSAVREGHLYFDASLSNPIYGNSNTVQPPALTVNIFQRINPAEADDGILVLTIETDSPDKIVDLTYQISKWDAPRELTNEFVPHAEIFWGDGASTSFTEQGQEISHTYETPGEYSIKIKGSIFWNGFPLNEVDKPNSRSLTNILTKVWVTSDISPVKDIGDRAFAGCTKITKVHERFFNGLINKKEIHLRGFFYQCTGLTEVQENLFESLKGYELIDLYYFFYQTGLTDIPENIFAPFTSAKEVNFERVFHSTKATVLPDNLFASLSNVEKADFSYFFPNVVNTLKIPETLFASLTKCKDINLTAAFYALDTATGFSIPAGLFSSFTSVEKAVFTNTFGRRYMTSIPETLFDSLTSATDVDFTMTFSLCSKVTSIPANLFSSLTNVKRAIFREVFSGNYSIPITSWSTIPATLFSALTNAEYADFNQAFAWNTKITTVPATLFHSLIKATYVSAEMCFLNCSALTTPPATLFAEGNLIEDLSITAMFQLTKVTNPSATIFNNLENCKNFNAAWCFSQTGTAFTLNENLFSSLTNAETVALTAFIYGGTSTTQTAVTIPENLFLPFQNAKTVYLTQFFVNRRIASIPDGLFKPFSNAETFNADSCFYLSISLSNTLPFPSGLFEAFKDIEKVDISGLFSGRTCTGSLPDNFLSNFANVKELNLYDFLPVGITNIPTDFLTGLNEKIESLSIGGLFKNVALSSIDKEFLAPLAEYKELKRLYLTRFYANFGQNNTVLKKNTFTSIPDGLLEPISKLENLEVVDLSNFFYYNTTLVDIPENLLSPLKGIEDITLDGTFGYCQGIKELPANLLDFDNTTKKLSLQSTFYNCSSLQSIPSTFFDNVPPSIEVMFSSCFQGCSAITSALPPLWDMGYTEPVSFGGFSFNWKYLTFYRCSNATNYQDAIANGWA